MGVHFSFVRGTKKWYPSDFDKVLTWKKKCCKKYTEDFGFLSYYEICQKIFKERWRTESQEGNSFAYKDNQWVSYDDEMRIKGKVRLLI